ncbi:hypothetical protein K491DRAFT_697034 [Lophiostoma macrostomum CBS 122681]|uniref:Membrane-associated proteins in eicosanoid and glutathione metabolism n=1 Tax=Lophiostoma macrostomum CBS 122681 TaxID=1314788 RepID=A0A6A6SUV7_9PLEO|nr:hypothetical protein K491DRAFT_697034 [Lophiostoma macrostomum CBS 122681]
MTTKIGLGIPMPMLAPATATWAVPFAAYYLFLQNRIVYHRLSNRKYLGDSLGEDRSAKDPLYVSTRAQLNFSENIPLALILTLLAELNGADRKYIHYALATLLALRVSHSELGLMRPGSQAPGRAIGYYGTEAVMLTLGGYLGYLVKDYWQFA